MQERVFTMRFVKFKTQARHTDCSGGNEPITPPSPEPQQQQHQSYLQRMCHQFASLRVSYAARHSTKENSNTKKQQAERNATLCDELISIDEDVVYRLGSHESDYQTTRHQHQLKPSIVGGSEPVRDKKGQQQKPPPPRYLLSWGGAKSRIQQTTTMLRDVCVTKSSALLSTAWRVYPGSSKQSAYDRSSSSSSGADTPPFKRSSKELQEQQQCEQWLLTASRESEISICMSYYSSRSLSDAATDSEDSQQTLKMMTAWRHRRTSSSGSTNSRELSENESDPFRRRCSSADSYVSNERGYSGVYRNVQSGGRSDEEEAKNDDDEDFREETIRESLFLRDGKLYAIRNEWF